MTHLIVFIHGFEGTGHDFDKAEKIFKERASAINDELQIRLLKVQCNSTFGGTYDGIEPGADWTNKEQNRHDKAFIASWRHIG